MKVLVACEFSGVVRDAFSSRGHDAWSCDILPTESPGQHIEGDVLKILDDGWDLMIAHPPCTFLANSGCKWLYHGGKKENGMDDQRWQDMYEGADFFSQLRDCPIPRIAIENPIPHKYARSIMGEYSQTVQPWQFGHTENKRTCLWLKNLPQLKETKNVKHLMETMSKKETDKTHYMSPGVDRGKRRSVTYIGIAGAMASQWGDLSSAYHLV